VQPVSAFKSLAWPTLIPGTSVIAMNRLIFRGIPHAQGGTHACVPKRPHSGVQARMMKMISTNELHEW
jgi:hypothetical protein